MRPHAAGIRRSALLAEPLEEGRVLAQALSDSIDEALREVLSEEVRDAVFRYFEATFHTSKADLPKHIEDFVNILSAIFGNSGSLVLGRAIAKRLYSKLGLRFTGESNRTLLDYLKQATIDSQAIQANERNNSAA